jgi:hypothetical protein
MDRLPGTIEPTHNTQALKTATVAVRQYCIGFVRCGADYEALDRDGLSKGRYPTLQDAIAALSRGVA